MTGGLETRLDGEEKWGGGGKRVREQEVGEAEAKLWPEQQRETQRHRAQKNTDIGRSRGRREG